MQEILLSVEIALATQQNGISDKPPRGWEAPRSNIGARETELTLPIEHKLSLGAAGWVRRASSHKYSLWMPVA